MKAKWGQASPSQILENAVSTVTFKSGIYFPYMFDIISFSFEHDTLKLLKQIIINKITTFICFIQNQCFYKILFYFTTIDKQVPISMYLVGTDVLRKVVLSLTH